MDADEDELELELEFGVVVETVHEPIVVQTAPRASTFGSDDDDDLIAYSPGTLRRIAAAVRSMIILVVVLVLVWLLMIGLSHLFGPGPIKWQACIPGITPYSPINVNLSWPYACSTQNQVSPQPCTCCVEGQCWRAVDIIANSSRMGTYYDHVDGIDGPRFRRLPEWMFVCTTPLNGVIQNCTKIYGLTVGRTLRAQELLYGWPPAGGPDAERAV